MEVVMFVQVIQGQVSDRDELKDALDVWQEQNAPHSIGALGSTAGVTADGYCVILARFESAEQARKNSDSHEQHQWWMETSKLFAGDVTFHDCSEVMEWGDGGSDQAGFVQVIQGRVENVERFRQLDQQMTSANLKQARPDVLGGYTALHDDGSGFTTAVYFTSEAAARKGEKAEMPAELQAAYQEQMELMTDAKYYDLTEPWLYTIRR
jgi:hypothetical protein